MMYGYGTGMGGWGYALMIVSLLLLCGLVIVGIVALVRPAAHRRPDAGEPAEPPGLSGPPRPSDPEQSLAARFARGEIDEDEYQRRLGVLRETSLQQPRHEPTPRPPGRAARPHRMSRGQQRPHTSTVTVPRARRQGRNSSAAQSKDKWPLVSTATVTPSARFR